MWAQSINMNSLNITGTYDTGGEYHITIHLPSGVTLKGTEAQLLPVLTTLGYSFKTLRWYKSTSTNQCLLISEMDTQHIRNALHKMCREHFDGKSISAPNLINLIEVFPPQNSEFNWLLEELKKRANLCIS
jgi:hypothetical protein